MKTVTLELSEESVKEMLVILERQQAEVQLKLTGIKKQIQQIKDALGIRNFTILNGNDSERRPTLKRTANGRSKRGESERAITEFLRNKNGAGASIKEITIDVGTNYVTTRRILKRLETQQKVMLHKGLWKWPGQ